MKPTLFEKLIARLQNHRLIAVLIVVGAVVIAVSAFTDASKNLAGLFSKPDQEAARLKLASLSVDYIPVEFIEAAGRGDLTLVRLFLAAGMDPNAILHDAGGPTALFLAAQENHPEIVAELLDAGAKTINQESNALAGAAQSGNVAILNLLLKTPVEREHLDAAFIVGKNREVLEVLLARGADPRKAGPEALLYAHDPVVLAFLTASGADINTKDAQGRMLIERLDYDRVSIDTLRTLIARGADVKARDRRGWTLLHAFAYAIPTRAEDLDLLLERGVAVDVANTDGRTPLSLACEGRNVKTVQHLLKKGADGNAKDHAGKTPLAYAREHSSPEMVRLLLEHGARDETEAKSAPRP